MSGAWMPLSTLLRGGCLPSGRAGIAATGINDMLTLSALKCWTASWIAQALVFSPNPDAEPMPCTIQRKPHAFHRLLYHAYICEALKSRADAVASRQAGFTDLEWPGRAP